MNNNIDISVIIGFRNWGAHRIRLSAQSILNSFGKYRGEVIISDYGSDDPAPIQKISKELGLKYVYTPGDPVWSRSRALNAGFALAEGKILASTDADMICGPNSFGLIYEYISRNPYAAFFVQTLDLPSQMSAEELDKQDSIDWKALEVAARLRPRWGMGTMMAIPRHGIESIRGFDERLHTYGAEDLDFALRATRAGYKTVWLNDPNIHMYHMWHPSSKVKANDTDQGRNAINFNVDIYRNDKTTVRNTIDWKHSIATAPPLVTVALVTRNRADFLKESIQSVLIQTLTDFELIIVDDGSTDHTEEIVKSFQDSRVRYIKLQQQHGISAARNIASKEAKGLYIAVQDDDDLMHPRRLEWQFESLTEGIDGTTGSSIFFDDATGNYAVYHGYDSTKEAHTIHEFGVPNHSTWMIKTEIFKAIPYDEAITSSVDHNIFMRMLRSGVKFKHTGKPHLLRRFHDRQISKTEQGIQLNSAKQSAHFYQFSITEEEKNYLRTKKSNSFNPQLSDNDLFNHALDFLPDDLIIRDIIAISNSSLPTDLTQKLNKDRCNIVNLKGSSDFNFPSQLIHLQEATFDDLVKIAKYSKILESHIRSLKSKGYTNDSLPSHIKFLPLSPTAQSNRFSVFNTLQRIFLEKNSDTTDISVLKLKDTKNFDLFSNFLSQNNISYLAGIENKETIIFTNIDSFLLEQALRNFNVDLWMTLGSTIK